jgi:pyridoxine kinase
LADIGHATYSVDRTLTDTKIEDGASLHKALMILHETYSVPNVVISSIPVEEWLKELIPPHIRSSAGDYEQSLLCLASARTTNSGSTSSRPSSVVYAACVPLIPGYFSGVGDLFSALVLGHYTSAAADNDGRASRSSTLPPLPRAVSLALTKTHAVLCLTATHASSLPPDEHTTTDDELDQKDPERLIRRMRGRELRLVQSRKILSGEAMGELRWLKEWIDFWKLN